MWDKFIRVFDGVAPALATNGQNKMQYVVACNSVGGRHTPTIQQCSEAPFVVYKMEYGLINGRSHAENVVR